MRKIERAEREAVSRNEDYFARNIPALFFPRHHPYPAFLFSLAQKKKILRR